MKHKNDQRHAVPQSVQDPAISQSQAASGSVRSARSRLLDNLLSLYLLQGLNYLIPLAVLPYLIRVLGVSGYGLVAFSQAFAQYFTILTDYGFNLSATRYIAVHKHDVTKIRSMFWQVLLIKLILGVVGFIILLAFTLSLKRFSRDAGCFLWAYLAVLGNVLFPQWYFLGTEKMRYISIFTGIAKLASAGLLFLFVHHSDQHVLAVALQSSGMLFAGLLGLGQALRQLDFRFEMPTMNQLMATLADGWHLFLSTAAVSLYTNTNMVLVGLLAGNTQAGYFSAAEKLIRAMTGLITPITQVLFPHINGLLAQSRELALRSISRLLRIMTLITLLPSAILLTFAYPVARLAFGAAAATGSVPVIRWIAFLPFLIAVSNVLGIQTMLPFGMDRLFSRILIASGIINVLGGIALISHFGATGAGISVLITEFFVTAAMFIGLRAEGLHVITGSVRIYEA